MKIRKNNEKVELIPQKLTSGDVVYMKGSGGTGSFYGIYSVGVGIIELENGSNAYTCNNLTKGSINVGDKISYWTVDRICKNAELVIND